jgi:predicted nucleotidyltransferase
MDRVKVAQVINKTLAYFDQFNFPLTAMELFDYLWEPAEAISLVSFLQLLEELISTGELQSEHGYYFLLGRNIIVEKRRSAVVLVEEKIRLAGRAASILRYVPFVCAIFVCNTVAAGWPTSESDIDVLIITSPRRLWLTRLLVTGVTSLINMRRNKKNIANKICLSFYLTANELDLNNVRVHAPDVYLAYWLVQLLPLYDPHDIYYSLLMENKWMHDFVPNYISSLTKSKKSNLFSIPRNTIIDRVEQLVRTIQKKRIESRPHAGAPGVVISDSMLKFHEIDRRIEYQNVWLERCKK